MEQRFTYQGQQYISHPEQYPGRKYNMESIVPSYKNKWSELTPTDIQMNNVSDNKGLENFHYYYASNTGIPGAFRPRPSKQQTTSQVNGMQQLFYDTQNLQYSTDDGKAPPIPIAFSNDHMFQQYDVIGNKKEKCGCGGPVLTGLF